MKRADEHIHIAFWRRLKVPPILLLAKGTAHLAKSLFFPVEVDWEPFSDHVAIFKNNNEIDFEFYFELLCDHRRAGEQPARNKMIRGKGRSH